MFFINVEAHCIRS